MNEQPSESARSRRAGRAFGVVGLLAAGAAVVVGGAAVLGGSAQPVLEVPDAAEQTTTSTTSTTLTPPVQTSTPVAVGELERSTADEGGRRPPTTDVPNVDDTVAPATTEQPTRVPTPPVAIETDRIDLSRFPVRPIGLVENGELEVPDETEIGWYQYGASPGEAGVTVLAAHVSWNRQLGPFANLATMEIGDTIYVTAADGHVEPYTVTERVMYPKDELPSERLWRNVGDESLALITCGGRFDDSINRYRDNIVVYATPSDG